MRDSETNLSHHLPAIHRERLLAFHEYCLRHGISPPLIEVKHETPIVLRRYYSDANYCPKCEIWIPKTWEVCKICGRPPRTKPRAKRGKWRK